MDKQEIIKKIKNITEKEAIADYHKLTNFNLDEIKNNTRIGNKFVDFFTFACRLETISKKKMTYWDFVSSTEYQNRKYIKRLMEYQDNKGIEYYTGMYSIFKLHCGSCSLFKPTIIMKIIQDFQPKCILDFTMGWGTALLSSCIMNVPQYIGIDTNMDLLVPYCKMGSALKTLGTTSKFTFMFKDCLDVDYSELKYDMVFTSPPYNNIEVYPHMETKTIQEWTNWYNQIFSLTYKHLEINGYFIINILTKIYKSILIPLFGEAHSILDYKKKHRNNNNCEPNEAIFIWKKN